MLTPAIIFEYERLLIGRKKFFPSYVFAENKDTKETIALDIIRYGIEKYLGWDKERVKTNLTYSILEKIKVFDLLIYIQHPPEIDPYTDLFFIVNKLYPGSKEFNFRDQVIGTYKKVLNGQLSRFPKGFFEGEDGEIRACLCLQYALNKSKVFASLEEGYSFFVSSEGTTFLKDAKIYGPISTLFTSPLEYFHCALGEELQSDLLFHYFWFVKSLGDIKGKATR